MIECCHYCVPPKRHLGCHATCEEYETERKAEEQKKADKKKANLALKYTIEDNAMHQYYLKRRKERLGPYKQGGRK